MVDLNIPTFITFIYLSLIQRAEHLLIYSFQDSRWRVLCYQGFYLILSTAKNGQRKRKYSVDFIPELPVTYGTHGILKTMSKFVFI